MHLSIGIAAQLISSMRHKRAMAGRGHARPAPVAALHTEPDGINSLLLDKLIRAFRALVIRQLPTDTGVASLSPRQDP
jgi:hypothetical protein